MHYNSELQDIADQLLANKDRVIKRRTVMAIIALFLVVVVVALSTIKINRMQNMYDELASRYDSLYADYEEAVCLMSIEEFVGDAMLHPVELTKEELCTAAVACCTAFPEVIVAQACVESGMGTSNLGKNYNNLFGMRYTPNDPLAIGNHNGWAIYACWQHALVSRIIWDERNKMPECETAEEYIDNLHKRDYFLDPLYKVKLLTLIKINNL